MKKRLTTRVSAISLLLLGSLANAYGQEGITPPYQETFDDESSAQRVTIIDANKDGLTWDFYDDCLYCPFTDNVADDDWVITPAIQLKAGSTYNVGCLLNTFGHQYPVSFEIKMGEAPTADGMTTTVVDKANYENESYAKVSNSVSVAKDGNYYIGYHLTAPYGNYAMIDSLFVGNGVNLQAPDSVSAFTGYCDPSGKNSATLSFRLPNKNMDGSELNSIDKAELLIGDSVAWHIDNPAPGSSQTVTVDCNEGYNNFTAVAYAKGEKGRESTLRLYAGFDAPANVQGTLKDENGSVVLSWDNKQNRGIHGGVVNPDDVTYSIYDDWSDYGSNVIATVKGQGTYTLPNVKTDEGDQQLLQYAIKGSNDKGSSDIVPTTELTVGVPYSIPYYESIAGGSPTYFIWTSGSREATYTRFTSVDDDEGAIALTGTAKDIGDNLNADSTLIHLPKISLKGAESPYLTFYTKSEVGRKSQFSVRIATTDGTEETIYNYDYANAQTADSSWIGHIVKIPAKYLQERYVTFCIDIRTWNPAVDFCIDQIEVRNIKSVDAHEAMVTPAYIERRANATLHVRVYNRGLEPFSKFNIRILANDKEASSTEFNRTIEPMCWETYDIPYKDLSHAEDTVVNIKAITDLEGDGLLSNNEYSVLIHLLDNDLPVPTNVKTDNQESANILKWQEPLVNDSTANDSFEDYYNQLYLSDYIGDWLTIDGDGGMCGMIDDIVPYNGVNDAMAFTVFDPSSTDPDYMSWAPWLAPRTGNKCMIATYSVGYDDDYNATLLNADNWLISPKLTGDEQTISFWASNTKTNDEERTEKIEVLYSLGGTSASDFLPLENGVHLLKGGDWQQITAELPEGALRFAIHHISQKDSVFLLKIDDAQFTVGSGYPVSYNIYDGDKLVGSVPASGMLSWDINSDESNDYSVAAVYHDGNESMPVKVSTANAISKVTVSPNRGYTVYSLGGQLIGRNLQSISDLRQGAYIINGKKIIIGR